jgi:hypothetical protein
VFTELLPSRWSYSSQYIWFYDLFGSASLLPSLSHLLPFCCLLILLVMRWPGVICIDQSSCFPLFLGLQNVSALPYWPLTLLTAQWTHRSRVLDSFHRVFPPQTLFRPFVSHSSQAIEVPCHAAVCKCTLIWLVHGKERISLISFFSEYKVRVTSYGLITATLIVCPIIIYLS